MFCKNCGEYIRGAGHYCSRCKNLFVYTKRKVVDEDLANELYCVRDESVFGSNFISFVLPIIGVILYLANKKSMPIKSQSIMGSLIFGCIVWCAVGLFFNVMYGMNVDVFASVQDLIVGAL